MGGPADFRAMVLVRRVLWHCANLGTPYPLAESRGRGQFGGKLDSR